MNTRQYDDFYVCFPLHFSDTLELACISHPSTQMIINDDAHYLIAMKTDLKLVFPIN